MVEGQQEGLGLETVLCSATNMPVDGDGRPVSQPH